MAARAASTRDVVLPVEVVSVAIAVPPRCDCDLVEALHAEPAVDLVLIPVGGHPADQVFRGHLQQPALVEVEVLLLVGHPQESAACVPSMVISATAALSVVTNSRRTRTSSLGRLVPDRAGMMRPPQPWNRARATAPGTQPRRGRSYR